MQFIKNKCVDGLKATVEAALAQDSVRQEEFDKVLLSVVKGEDK
jgi:hypothetical protein